MRLVFQFTAFIFQFTMKNLHGRLHIMYLTNIALIDARKHNACICVQNA